MEMTETVQISTVLNVLDEVYDQAYTEEQKAVLSHVAYRLGLEIGKKKEDGKSKIGYLGNVSGPGCDSDTV